MPLRTKLTVTFFVLLLAPIVALSVFSLDRAVGLMVDNLGASADLMSRQVFEEMRIALDQKKGAPPEDAFRNDQSITMLLRSIQAFGPAIVRARIVAPDGRIVMAASARSTIENIGPNCTGTALGRAIARCGRHAITCRTGISGSMR